MSISYNEIIQNKYMKMKLKELRTENNYTQEYIAKHLNIKQNTYSQYENELREIPIEYLVKLAMLYDTSVDYILNITDEEFPYPRKK